MSKCKKQPKFIAITGGPCSGKSTFLERLKQDARVAEQAVFVPEAASLVLPGFLAVRESLQHDRTSSWQQSLQSSITRLQYDLEETYAMHALETGKHFVICDRGLRDAEVYTAETRSIYASIGHTALSALHRYSGVLHLESLATSTPDLYETQSNPSRYEASAEEAQIVEQRTIEAWAGHHDWVFIRGQQQLISKMNEAEQQLDELLVRI